MTTQATYFNNPEAERSLLGAVLMHNNVLDKHRIPRDIFYDEAHRQIFDEILAIRARGCSAPSFRMSWPKNRDL